LVLAEFIQYFSESVGYWSQIRQGAIQLPALDGQRRVVRVLDEQAGLNRGMRSEIGTQLDLLQERKRALITAAVTGEFDVTTATGRGVA